MAEAAWVLPPMRRDVAAITRLANELDNKRADEAVNFASKSLSHWMRNCFIILVLMLIVSIRVGHLWSVGEACPPDRGRDDPPPPLSFGPDWKGTMIEMREMMITEGCA